MFADSAPADVKGESEFLELSSINNRAQRFLQECSSSDSEPECENDPCPEKLSNLKHAGCGCSKVCIDKFSEKDLHTYNLNVREMTKNEKELLVMSAISQ